MNRWMLALALCGATFAGCDDTSNESTADAGMGGEGGGAGGEGGGAGGEGGGAGGEGGGAGGEGGGAGGEGGGAGGEGGGAGGEGGGAGGEGGEGGGGGDTGSCDAPHMFADNGDGTWSATGTVSGDDHQGSCSTTEDQDGNPNPAADAVVTFTAPEAGIWRFDTINSMADFDTVLYARTTCDDAGSELACNDDYGDWQEGQVQSVVALELEAGATVFLVADSFSGEAEAEFTVTAQRIEATAPVIETAEAVRAAEAFGFRLSGMDAEGDVAGVWLEFLDAEGTPLAFTDEGDTRTTVLAMDDIGGTVNEDGTFTSQASFSADVLPEGVVTLRIVAVDALGLESEPAEAAFGEPATLEVGDACANNDAFAICGPDTLCSDEGEGDAFTCMAITVLDDGAECDPESQINVCAEGSLCLDPEADDTANCIVPTAPNLMSAEIFYNGDLPSIGVRMAGMDPENDTDFFSLTFLDMGGNAIAYDWGEGPIETVNLNMTWETEDGNFTGELSGTLNAPVEGLTQVRLTVTDANGLVSNELVVDVAAPAAVEPGAACDLNEAFSACGEGFGCIGSDVNAPLENPMCIAETAPVLGAAMAFRGEDAFGFRVEGTDAESNAAGIYVQFLNADGEVVGDQEDGLAVGWTSSNWDGMAYTGLISLPFNTYLGCTEDAALDACVAAGNDPLACIFDPEAIPTFQQLCLDERAPMLDEIAQVRVQAFDTTEQRSEWSDALELPAPAMLETGSLCLTNGNVGTCAEGEVCGAILNEANRCLAPVVLEAGAACSPASEVGTCAEGTLCLAADEGFTCQEPVMACPDDWAVGELAAIDGGWQAMGDNTESAITAAGSCGGGGAVDVYSFTAPEAGLYSASISAEFDTVMYARSFCAVPTADFELACNDDAEGFGLRSGYTLELEAGATVYLFVDSFNGGGAGPYTLNVMPGELMPPAPEEPEAP